MHIHKEHRLIFLLEGGGAIEGAEVGMMEKAKVIKATNTALNALQKSFGTPSSMVQQSLLNVGKFALPLANLALVTGVIAVGVMAVMGKNLLERNK